MRLARRRVGRLTRFVLGVERGVVDGGGVLVVEGRVVAYACSSLAGKRNRRPNFRHGIPAVPPVAR